MIRLAPLQRFPVPRTLFITLHGIYKNCALILCVKRQFLQPCMPLPINAHIVFCVKLHRSPRLPPHNRTQVWPADTDDAVLHTVRLVVIYVLLLFIELPDGKAAVCIFPRQNYLCLMSSHYLYMRLFRYHHHQFI